MPSPSSVTTPYVIIYLFIDVRDFVQTQLYQFSEGFFTVIWASPPCTEYSRAMTGPRPRDLDKADELVSATFACIMYLKPRYFCIENPEGLLRKRPLMQPYSPYLRPVSYCRYGTLFQKNTCLWTNLPIQELHVCTKGTPCKYRKVLGHHVQTAQSGPAGDTPGSGAGKNVHFIPRRLLKTLFAPEVLLSPEELDYR